MSELRDPVRNVNQEFLSGLELVSNKVFPLPGATLEKRGDSDPRLSKLTPIAGVVPNTKITVYEHVATLRHRETGRFFVAFRQTMDALLMEQSDTKMYPEWLIKSDVKKTELRTYIYAVREKDGQPLLPARLPIIRSHEDWLAHVAVPWVFDTLAYFLLKNHIISEEMFKSIS